MELDCSHQVALGCIRLVGHPAGHIVQVVDHHSPQVADHMIVVDCRRSHHIAVEEASCIVLVVDIDFHIVVLPVEQVGYKVLELRARPEVVGYMSLSAVCSAGCTSCLSPAC